MTTQGQPELTPVREGHRFDEAKLEAYLRDRLPDTDGALSIHQFEGGQSNPTFLLSWPNRRFVLRKKPPGVLLKSAHQVEREYRVMKALAPTAVPVPEMFHLCEDDDVMGTPFFVMEHVEGRILEDPCLPGLPADEQSAIYDHLVEVLAALHAVQPDEIGLGDFGRPGNYYARQISRWSKQYEASKTGEIPAMDALMKWLPEQMPDTEETCIAHGDFRVGNCLIHPTEPRVVAVLDWELSTLGHPLGDLAYFCQGYHSEAVPGGGLLSMDFTQTGVPSEEKVLETYRRYSGRTDLGNWQFYVAFVLFRTAAIVQGVYKRGLDGNASSQRAGEYGVAAIKMAETAWTVAQSAQ